VVKKRSYFSVKTGDNLVGDLCSYFLVQVGDDLVRIFCSYFSVQAGDDLVGNFCSYFSVQVGDNLVGNFCSYFLVQVGDNLVGNFLLVLFPLFHIFELELALFFQPFYTRDEYGHEEDWVEPYQGMGEPCQQAPTE